MDNKIVIDTGEWRERRMKEKSKRKEKHEVNHRKKRKRRKDRVKIYKKSQQYESNG